MCVMHIATTAGSPLSESVASEIRAEMGRRGITQSILAERLQLSPLWVSRRLSPGATRRTPLSLDDLDRIAAVLDVPVSALLGAVKA